MSTAYSRPTQGDGKVSKSIAGRLGVWVAGLSLDQVPPSALHIARRCIVDTISVAVKRAWRHLIQRQTALEHISIAYSIASLRTYPYVSVLEEKGRLSLHGAWFDISNGELWVMNPKTRDFFLPPGEPM